MPKVVKRLTDKQIENAKSKKKDYKLCDGEGLYLLIRKSGSKVWQYPYQYNNKRTVFTIGRYHQKGTPGHISLQDARQKRYEIRALLDQGKDPNELKHAQRAPKSSENSFESIAREWHSKNVWVERHSQRVMNSLESKVFPFIGTKHINEVTTQEIVKLLERIETRGTYDTAKRICQRCENIFDYALGKGLCLNNPASGRSKFIKRPQSKNHPHLKEHELGEFLHRLDQYDGRAYVRIGLKMQAYTFVRSGELRKATWDEIDFEKKTWTISAERMKMRRTHMVPLSKQVIEMLTELKSISGRSDYLFPGLQSPHKPLSDTAHLKVLKIMGYVGDKKIVPHGFRHTASTILNEHRFHYDVIERQLAHVQKNSVRRVYNHAEYEQERRTMMQWYADHLDKLKQMHLEP